jgi:hypothetical protein
LIEIFLQTLDAVGQPFLLSGETTDGVAAILTLTRFAQFGRHLTLAVGELAGLELHIAHCAVTLVRRTGLDPLLEIAQLVEGPVATLGRLGGILAPQLAGRAAHFLAHLSHAIAVVAAARRGLLAIAALPGLARLAVLTAGAAALLTGLTLLSSLALGALLLL